MIYNLNSEEHKTERERRKAHAHTELGYVTPLGTTFKRILFKVPAIKRDRHRFRAGLVENHDGCVRL